MLTIISQNAIQPHNTKYECLVLSEAQLPTPRSSVESHHDRHCRNSSITNGRSVKDAIASGKAVAPDEIQSTTTASTAFTKKHSQKAPPPAIQTSALSDQSGKSDFTSSKSVTSSSSTSPSTSFSTPMGHIRRWTSSLSSSSSSSSLKKQQQGQGASPSSKPSMKKVRTIGPISAPLPLMTHSPYACTPLPYSDSSMAPINAKMATINLYSTELQPLTKLVTSCSGVPNGGQPTLELSQSDSLSKSRRTSWKNRLFYSTSKNQDRQASTNYTVNDEWSNQGNDSNGISNPTMTTQRVDRPRVRISLPLTQPTLPANQKTVPIVTTPLSPTDGLFGTDVFDPFKIAPTIKDGETRSLTSTFDNNRSIMGLLGPPNTQESSSQLRDQEQCATTKGSYSTSGECIPAENQCSVIEGLAIGPGKNLESEVVLAVSYLGAPHDSVVDSGEPHPIAEVKDTSKSRSPPRRRSSRALSTFSSSSDSSDASTLSTDSSSSNSSDSSQSSPISGAFFYTARIDATVVPVATSPATADIPAKSLPKSSAIRIPANLMTFFPGSSGSLKNKKKSTSPNPFITPPTTPPLEQPEELSREDSIIGRPSPPTASTPTPSKTSSIVVDPRVMTLKRLAYMHTIKKLREQERRPFRHSVQLHLIILQLHKGITNFQCNEIEDFYTSMWTAQFPGQWDMTNMMAMTQKQTLLQKQHQLQQKIQQQQQQNQQLYHTSAKSNSKEVGSGNKERRSKRSLVSSIQSRIQSSKAKGASGDNISSSSSSIPSNGSGIASCSPSLVPQPHFASPRAATGQSPALKGRPPLPRTPTYPLINIEKKTLFTFAPVRKAPKTTSATTTTLPASTKDNSFDFNNDGDEGFKGEDKDRLDKQHKGEVIRPSQRVIIPKRTTGRKGILYQQQQQFQLQNQQQLQVDHTSSAFLPPRIMAMNEQRQAWIQAQLIGTRPQFATSTYTTVSDSRSEELVTRPLILSSMNSSLWEDLQTGYESRRPNLPLSGITGQAGSFTSPSSYGARSSSSPITGNMPLPLKDPRDTVVASDAASVAGLLTPPPSPLFYTSFTHASLPAPLPETGSIPAGPPVAYLTSNSRIPHSHNYLPATHDHMIINNTRVSEDIRQQQHCIGGLATFSEKAQVGTYQQGLPSPPLSPTMDPNTTAISISARVSSSSNALHASHNMPVSELARDKQSQQYDRHQTTGGYIGRTARTDKMPWLRNRSAREIKTRHSMDDAR